MRPDGVAGRSRGRSGRSYWLSDVLVNGCGGTVLLRSVGRLRVVLWPSCPLALDDLINSVARTASSNGWAEAGTRMSGEPGARMPMLRSSS